MVAFVQLLSKVIGKGVIKDERHMKKGKGLNRKKREKKRKKG